MNLGGREIGKETEKRELQQILTPFYNTLSMTCQLEHIQWRVMEMGWKVMAKSHEEWLKEMKMSGL